MSTKKSFAAILIGAITFSSAAFATTYKCNVRTNSKYYGGIPSTLVFSVDESEPKVMVYDVFIKRAYDRPVEADIVVINPKRYTFKWTVDVPTTEDDRTEITTVYRATYLKRTHKVSVRGFPKGYDVDVGGTGTCIPLK